MENKLKNAIKAYLSGETLRRSSKSFSVDEQRVKKVLIRLKKLRTRSEQISKSKGNYTIKHNCLDVLTPDALYWVGFLAADGNISSSERNRIQVKLGVKDAGHLEKMSLFFGNGLKVKKTKTYASLRFSSVQIYNRLISLGFSNKKTYSFSILPALKYSRDFWRGYIDGDGWVINTNKTKAIGLCSYLKSTTDDFIEFIIANGINTTQISSKKNRQELYTVQFKETKFSSIKQLLYDGATIYLERKFKNL